MTQELGPGRLIKADLYSRQNAMNGKYRAAQIGLDDLSRIKDKDLFFLKTLEIKADLADKMIAEAEAQGKNTTDLNVMKELGAQINAAGQPVHQSESVMAAISTSLYLILVYGIAIGVWGLVFDKSFLIFGLCGVAVGLIISLLSAAPVIAYQRTKEGIGDMSFAASAIWGNLGIIIGGVGLVALVIRLLFFK